ncbi:hypothetical protein A8M77_21815 [Variovorax sp. JS1663]|nr:hypothetical protein A8M77_21815 [Variovorax sp. JS1663]
MQGVLAALRKRWLAAGRDEPTQSEADVLRGLGLARWERVSYQVGASGRVRVVHQGATPDPVRLLARPASRH